LAKTVTGDLKTGAYNLGTGVGASLIDVIGTIEKVTGVRAKVRHADARKSDVRSIVLDIEKALATGWKPRHSLESGIREQWRRIEAERNIPEAV
jgi:UDP-glucose 4-epimerase